MNKITKKKHELDNKDAVRDEVLELLTWEGVNNFRVVDLVKEWCNCIEAEIDQETGDIWVANPMSGNWLSDEALRDFVSWVERQ